MSVTGLERSFIQMVRAGRYGVDDVRAGVTDPSERLTVFLALGICTMEWISFPSYEAALRSLDMRQLEIVAECAHCDGLAGLVRHLLKERAHL